jgi:hypothetical protein
MAGFGIGGVEPLGSASTVFFYILSWDEIESTWYVGHCFA